MYTGTGMSHAEYSVAPWPLFCVEFQTGLYLNESNGTALRIPFLELKT